MAIMSTPIEPFRVERWMDEYETTVKYNIAETCAASISIDDICSWADVDPRTIFSQSHKLTYGPIRGSEPLRENLAALYNSTGSAKISKDDILICNGAIGANFAVLYSLISKGDHVICHHPTYQQLYSVPKSLGADVDLWRTHPENGWQLDLDQLKAMVQPKTRMIILNDPQNPTGQFISKSALASVIEIAKQHDLYVFVDEVYRPLFHGIQPTDPEYPPAAVAWDYDKIVSTGSMSKAFSLAGIRLGWIASRSAEIIDACAGAREYTLISVSQLDDRLATIATGKQCVQRIIERNIALAQHNLGILDSFIKEHAEQCEYVRPVAGTTAFVRFSRDGQPIDDVAFCKAAHASGILLVPGDHCFAAGSDFRGYVRIGYVCNTEELMAGLKALGTLIKEKYHTFPLAVGA